MAKTRIVLTLDHHPATRALSRLLVFLEWAKTGYGVNSLDVEIEENESA